MRRILLKALFPSLVLFCMQSISTYSERIHPPVGVEIEKKSSPFLHYSISFYAYNDEVGFQGFSLLKGDPPQEILFCPSSSISEERLFIQIGGSTSLEGYFCYSSSIPFSSGEKIGIASKVLREEKEIYSPIVYFLVP